MSLTVVLVAGLLASAGSVRAAFPGANGKIVYERGVLVGGHTQGHIWVMNPDGSDQKDLSGSAGSFESQPAFSADGSKIAFVSYRSGTYNIWVMNADGTGATNVTKDQTDNNPEDPTWSPDGTMIAFSVATQNLSNSEIYIINADGSGLVQLTNTPRADSGGAESDPTWSPDGTKLAFADGAACGGERGIFVMNVDGTNRDEVTSNTYTGCEDQPTWSPDGAKLAFVNSGQLWVVNADGSNPLRVITSVRSFKGVAWSPDGTKLAFATEQGNLSVIGIDGTGEVELIVTADVEQTPDWAPGVNEIQGTEDDDTITGTSGNDVIFGGGGNDSIDGGGGVDTIYGELGDDTIDGGAGDDSILGGDGNDTLTGTLGNDTLDGGVGDDKLTFDSLSSDNPSNCCRGTILGGDGNDTIDVTGTDEEFFPPFSDFLDGGSGADVITYDVVSEDPGAGGKSGGEVLGGGGNDTIDISGTTIVKGGGGNDTISEGCPQEGSCDPDGKVLGGGGNDEITGVGGDELLGGAGNDTINQCIPDGQCFPEGRIEGGGGKDTIFARNGVQDIMRGGSGRDKARIDRTLDDVSGIERFI